MAQTTQGQRLMRNFIDPAPDAPIAVLSNGDFLIAQVDGRDDYRLGAYLESTDQRAIWQTDDGKDVAISLDELRGLYNLSLIHI